MNAFIDALMKKMTLEEKIGQLNLPGAGDITTGQASNSDIGKEKKGPGRRLVQYQNPSPRSGPYRKWRWNKAG